MFIRFVSGDIDAQSHTQAGLFCAAYKLRYERELPEYDLDRLLDLLGWFNTYLRSPFESRLRKGWRRRRAICWFKSSALEHLGRAHEMVALLEDNDVYIRTIKSEKIGYRLYEDDAQVLAQPFADMRLNF
ncbi:MAG: hypothetical protein H0U54_13395 [Acidobacteria bacterium]|nr:hypothetical protein [Acidobacteriota bacterium]